MNTDRYHTDRSGGPMRTGLFTVHIGDVDIEGWRSVTVPSTATEAGNWRNGNDADYERPPWGRTTYDDLDMERAVDPIDPRVWDWRQAVIEGRVDEAMKAVAITVLDEEREPQVEWQCFGAWISDYDPPDLDASADGEVATASITITYNRMMRDAV